MSYGESLILSSPEAEVVIADKGYDSQALRDFIKSRNAQHVIPRKGNSKQGNDDIDWCLYRYRHLVENAFLKVKKYRAVATRYEKLARNYEHGFRSGKTNHYMFFAIVNGITNDVFQSAH